MIRIACKVFAVMMVALIGAQAPAQEMTPEQMAEMEAYIKAGTPGDPHRAMAQMVGAWDLKIKSWMEPGAPAIEDAGTAKRSMTLGGRVLVEEFSGSMMGQPFTGYGMRGYDNVTGEHWSTWNDSMSTGIMLSKGTCDAKGTCTFTGSYNDPVRKSVVTMRMTTRQESPTKEIFEMYGPDKSGQEMKMMEIVYTKR